MRMVPWCSCLRPHLWLWNPIRMPVHTSDAPFLIQVPTYGLGKLQRMAQVIRSLNPRGRPEGSAWFLASDWSNFTFEFPGAFRVRFGLHKTLLGKFASVIREPGFESQLCSWYGLAADVHPGRQQVTGLEAEFLPTMWKTNIVIPIPASAWPCTLYLCLYFSISISLSMFPCLSVSASEVKCLNSIGG